jgi:hypothetical protein
VIKGGSKFTLDRILRARARRAQAALEQYCCPRNSDSYFVNIGYDRTAISFVDLHTAEFKSNIVLKQYAWPTYGFLDENAAYLFITNLRCRIYTAVLEYY